MSKSSVFCIALSRGRAGRIVLDLKEAEFSNTEISALFLDQSANAARRASTGNTVTLDETMIQPAEVICGVMVWIAAVGCHIIPGVDPIIAAGPLAAALSDETVGGVFDGLTNLGVPHEEARRYEGRGKNGHILVSVHTDNPDFGVRAREIFAAAGAEDICTATAVSKSKRQSRIRYGLSDATIA